MRTRSFRVAPADDDELLAVEPFGLALQAAVSRRVRRMERLRHHALKTELARVLQDAFAVARLMAIELKAELARHQRLEQRLALDERQPCGVLAIDVQEVEGVIDERRAAPRSPSVAAWVRAKLGNPASSTPQSSPSR